MDIFPLLLLLVPLSAILLFVSHFWEQRLALAPTLNRPSHLALAAIEPSKPPATAKTGPTPRLGQDHLELARSLLKLGSPESQSSDLNQVLAETLRLSTELMSADAAAIFTIESDPFQLKLRSSLGLGDGLPTMGQPSQYRLAGSLAQRIIQAGRSDMVSTRGREDHSGFHSAIGAPMTINGESMGALVFLSRHPDGFQREQLVYALAAAGQAASAFYNAELFHLIRDQASRQGGMIREKRMEASRSHAILESIAEGVLVTDASNQVTLFNAAAERILRLDRRDVLGQSAYAFIGVYGEAGERWMKALKRWNQAPAKAQPQEQLETRLVLEDGRYVSLTVAPVSFESEFIGTVTTFRDVTHAVEVDRLKSEFVATVSHELRTPMTSVKGYVEMLMMETVGAINDDQRRFLQVIKTNIDRLGGLVNDLLDISRIESGRVQLSLEAVDLVEMAHEIREAFLRKSRIDSKPMNIELHHPPSLPKVEGDHDRLRQILSNLVENSFNYTPADGLIQVTLEQDDGFVRATVSDNGIGIKPADQARVFERFFRGEQALNMSVAGTGLGLSIVRQLVEMHGGFIALESEGVPGQGTKFVFTVPLFEEAEDES